ncbi:L-serine ammonia-lyase, iron-sulfur-dependent, subunit alpha [Caproicibacterium amylolyticum]|jgi:L-serine dehydratase|uniref:L-serine dehydratase n=1 Tax=Caproicibacterium amylolyticum TaxID=2766537 RepID=A0A7G9WKV3_9FIRM|nr:L-serine ammonia-lyase, iron-sulfur-dependent, subunit alpha [Caproicibacterium amylolyticum]QNO19315.1 L-serine ammonia-lyase, iron-sulfur-dependent, subunit alpha [Caproicibacterium amylolyticum]
MSYYSVKQMLEDAKENKMPLWETIMMDDVLAQHSSREASLHQMQHLWEVMKTTSTEYRASDHSHSGLVGGDSAKVTEAAKQGCLIGDNFLNEIIAEALKIGECNACMKRIVATPTAGSCGVLPAVLIPLAKKEQLPDEAIVYALYVAAGFGQVVAQRASIAGASGGCQAEIGTASAMAAAALTALKGGSSEMCAHACAMALSNLLGLVCDPVAGLVEVPCVQRNVAGALNAVGAANMALSGVVCRIPADEVIDAMGEIGDQMSADLRETGRGGLAATPTGKKIAAELLRH